MKKTLLLGALLSVGATAFGAEMVTPVKINVPGRATTVATPAKPTVEASLDSIENEFRMLEQKEQARFANEQKKAEEAAARYNDYANKVAAIQEKTALIEANLSTSSYKSEQKKILRKYKALEKELLKKMDAEKKVVESFEQLRAAMGY